MAKQVWVPNVGVVAAGTFVVALVLLLVAGHGFFGSVIFAIVLTLGVALFFVVAQARSEAVSLPGSSPDRARRQGHAEPAGAAPRPDATKAPAATAPAAAASHGDAPSPPEEAAESEPSEDEAAGTAGAAAEPDAARADAAAQSEPDRLDAPRDGQPDDLKRIQGIGPKIEEQLNGMGIFHLEQIAAWGPSEVAWMDEHLEDFRGRVSRDDWVGQAQRLSRGEEPGHERDGEVVH